MIDFCRYFYNYTILCYKIYDYVNYYNNNKIHNDLKLDTIIQKINSCGSVAIKFCQWVIPKLELMYLEEEDILNRNKPSWLTKLESFFENCEEHSIDYTNSEYYKTFGKNINDDYEILDIIGSGSIGQVYLLQDKPYSKYINKEKYVMKIIHPNTKEDIKYFRYFYNFINLIPCIKNYINENFPFDIYSFINQFNEQSNFINESNNLLTFQNKYEDNNFIIIPKLIKTSESIMIMTYEEGVSFEDLKDINTYHKYKLALLFCSFVRNNQQILNFNHGDLHKGNWKIKLSDNNNHKIIIYDFGFCWETPKYKTNKDIINQSVEMFENCDSETETIDFNIVVNVLKHVLKYNISESDIIDTKIKKFLKKNIYLIKPWSVNPVNFFKILIALCKEEKLLIDPILVQALIILVQCQKIFVEYRMVSGEKDEDIINSYEVYRTKYLDWLSYYKTNDIFKEFTNLINDLLNKKQVKVENIFDTIKLPTDFSINFKELALGK